MKQNTQYRQHRHLNVHFPRILVASQQHRLYRQPTFSVARSESIRLKLECVSKFCCLDDTLNAGVEEAAKLECDVLGVSSNHYATTGCVEGYHMGQMSDPS